MHPLIQSIRNKDDTGQISVPGGGTVLDFQHNEMGRPGLAERKPGMELCARLSLLGDSVVWRSADVILSPAMLHIMVTF